MQEKKLLIKKHVHVHGKEQRRPHTSHGTLPTSTPVLTVLAGPVPEIRIVMLLGPAAGPNDDLDQDRTMSTLSLDV